LGAGLAGATLAELASDVVLYLGAAALLVLVAGTLLVRRYARTVRDVQSVGYVILLATVALLLANAQRAFAFTSTPYEWLLTTALHTGEFLLAALLLVWAVLVVVQMGALLLGFALARSATPDVAASLMTARIGLTVSTALFVMLSLVLWSVIGYVAGLALTDLMFIPLLLGEGYRSAANFFEAQVQDVGTLFTPLMALAGAIGAATVVALAPGLREEIAPTAEPPADAAARLGRWWSAARHQAGRPVRHRRAVAGDRQRRGIPALRAGEVVRRRHVAGDAGHVRVRRGAGGHRQVAGRRRGDHHRAGCTLHADVRQAARGAGRGARHRQLLSRPA
jgi:hypothetical protein